MTGASPRAVIYTRISRDREGAGLGVDRQEQDCRALAGRLGLSVDTVLVDNDLSAFSGKPRPGYQQLLDGLAAGCWAAVLAWHSDRLHRSPRELETFVDVIERCDATVETVTAGPLDLRTPSGRMVARQLGAVARYESEHRAERLKRKHEELAAAGKPSGGPRAYGYGPDHVTVIPAEAAVVKEACERLVAGSSVRSISSDFNRRGVPTAQGGRWTPAQVRQTVVRRRNVGERVHHGAVTPACWPALVDRETWEDACAVVSDPSRLPAAGNGRKHLLSGILTCGCCGSPVKAGVTGRGVPIYRCGADVDGRRSCLSRDLAHVDRFVTRLVVARLGRPDAAQLFVRPDEQDRASLLDAKSRRIERQLDQVGEAFVADALDATQLVSITTKLRDQLEQLQVERAALVRQRQPALVALVSAADVVAAWAELDLPQRRAVIVELMTVRLLPSRRRGPGFDPESVDVAWK